MSDGTENTASLAVCPGKNSEAPYPPEELVQLGKIFARLVGAPGPVFRDAVQEFAASAWKAAQTATHCRNIRAFQVKAGKWAALNFLRRERSRREMEEKYALEQFSAPKKPEDWSPENIVDQSARDPLQILILREEAERAMAMLRTLPELHQRIFREIVFEARTMEGLAQERGVSRQYIGQIYRKVVKKLRAVCTPFNF